MAEELCDIDEMDTIMSQIDTEPLSKAYYLEKLNKNLDEMDTAMSQIDLEKIVMENGGSANNSEQQLINDPEIGSIDMETDHDLESHIPDELLKQYEEAMGEILPKKSVARYVQALEVFKKWQASYGTTSVDEKVIMAYFSAAGKKYAPTTLWSMYSMLKRMLIYKNNIDISKYSQLAAFLKTKADGYQCKKAKVFTPEEINKFIVKAPNVLYLGMKTVLAFGVTGACRGDELTNLTTNNVRDNGNEIVVKIPNTKTKEPKLHLIDGEFANIIREYVKLRSSNAQTNRFFLQYRNGKCINQVMGKNSIAKIPKEIAKFLELPEPEKYTGHSYRRTSATIAANAGATWEDLKRHGRWKSDKVLEGYIQESFFEKRKMTKMISKAIQLPSTRKVDKIDEGPTCDEIEPEKKFIPMSMSVGSSSHVEVSAAGNLLSTDNKENIIFHFGKECRNFTIINMK